MSRRAGQRFVGGVDALFGRPPGRPLTNLWDRRHSEVRSPIVSVVRIGERLVVHVEIEAPRILAPTHRWGPIPTAAASIQTTAGSSGVLRSDPKLNRSPSSGVPRRLGVDQRLGRWRPGRPREESRGRRSQRGIMPLDGKSPGLVTRPKLPIMSVWAAPTDVDRMADSSGKAFCLGPRPARITTARATEAARTRAASS